MLFHQHFFFVITTVYPFLAKLFLHTLQPADQQDAKFVADSKAKWLAVMGPSLVAALGDKPYLLGYVQTRLYENTRKSDETKL